jgi:acyl carrier protein
MNRDEIFDKVKEVEVLVEALGVDDDEVKPTATLFGDLGAESIDILDISFQLEQAFGFKIAQGELIPESVLRDPKYVVDGKVTPEGVRELKSRMPWVDFSMWEKDPQVRKVAHQFTVDTLVKFVDQKLAKQPA